MNLEKYKTIVFDCDGVVLNSNKVKTDAFYKTALPYGEEAAQKLVAHHVLNGGVSRYKKFEWFIQEILPTQKGIEITKLLEVYAKFVRHGLKTCDAAEGLAELRAKTPQANWLIVSGGDQQELREVFSDRKLIELFDGGIFGSPENKDLILARELANNNIKLPALFLGDSRYDHVAASTAKLDFIFLSGWSEFLSWPEYCTQNQIKTLDSIFSLI
jgi:phosphoglycolate phosphatase-like HAD superfamily hydrolase